MKRAKEMKEKSVASRKTLNHKFGIFFSIQTNTTCRSSVIIFSHIEMKNNFPKCFAMVTSARHETKKIVDVTNEAEVNCSLLLSFPFDVHFSCACASQFRFGLCERMHCDQTSRVHVVGVKMMWWIRACLLMSETCEWQMQNKMNNNNNWKI